MTMTPQRLVIRILAGHVRDRLADPFADARPGRRSGTYLEPQKFTEHGASEPRRESRNRTRIPRDVPAKSELHQMTIGSICVVKRTRNGEWL